MNRVELEKWDPLLYRDESHWWSNSFMIDLNGIMSVHQTLTEQNIQSTNAVWQMGAILLSVVSL